MRVYGGGALYVRQGGLYDAQGTTEIRDYGRLFVDDGEYRAAGTTTLNGSALLWVRGASIYTAGDTITVNGGEVAGNGTIAGGQLLNNLGGTIRPGVGSIDTLHLVGTYNQGPGGKFEANVQPGGPADRFVVNGSASLAGSIEIVAPAATFAVGEQFRIIATDAPIAGIFDTGIVTGDGAGDVIVWVGRATNAGTPDMAGNNVDVIVAPSFATLTGLSANQQGMAGYLGGRFDGRVLIEDNAFFLITQIVAGGPNALDQIGGEVYDSFTTFAFDTARQYGRLVDDRVRTLRCAAQSGAANVLCGGGSLFAGTTSGMQVADAGPGAIAAPGADSPRGFSPNTHPYGWSVWVSGIGSYLSKDRTTNNLGYNGFTTGGVMGVDLAITKRWLVGIMVGGSKSNINFSGVGGDGDLSNVGIGVYTAWYGSKWFADASFTYSKNWIEADRNLQFGTVNSTAKGKTEGDQLAAHATLGYGFALGRTALEVSGGVDWVHLRQYGFTETGAGLLNLTVNSRTDDSLRLRIGVRAAHPFVIHQGLMLVPSLKVGYARELMDNTRPITSSFGGIPGSFTVNGDDGSQDILTFGAGVKADWSQGITASVDYNGEWAGDRQIHGVTGRLHIRW